MRSYLTAGLVMLNSAVLFAQTAAAGGATPGTKNMMPTLLMMGIVFAIIYFLMIMPQQKKQKETQNMLKNMKKGDRIVTVGGMLGTVGNVKDDTVMVKIADNTVVEFRKSAIGSILGEPKAGDKSEPDKLEKKA